MSSLQYLTDEAGHKTAVLLPIGDFEKLMEDVIDLAAVAERRHEPTIPHTQFVKEIKENGSLPD